MKFYKIKFLNIKDEDEVCHLLYDICDNLRIGDNLYIINREAFDKEIKFYDNLEYEKEDYEIS